MTDTTRLLLLDPAPDDAARFEDLVAHDASHPWAVETVDGVESAARSVARGIVDALIVSATVLEDAAVLGRVRAAAADCALIVVRRSDDESVPIDPQDVGVQSTLDLWTLDRHTLSLTLRLAVERNRLVLTRALARDQAARLAEIHPARDELTGLPSGEHLLQEVDRFVADAVRFARHLTVALLTVDGLADTRHAHGEGVANSIVIHAAGLLSQCLRTSDVLGRLDGDQLLIAMPGTDGSHAAVAARRIQAHAAAAPYVSLAGRFPIEVTVGLASLTGLMAVDELVFQADGALREAMARGPAGLLHASDLTLH